MRRDTFLKTMAALAAAGALPMSARAASNLKMMIPANPGGGWDGTGRALGKALQEAGVADAVTYELDGDTIVIGNSDDEAKVRNVKAPLGTNRHVGRRKRRQQQRR